MKILVSWVGLVLVLVVFLAFNVLAGTMFSHRIDMTENRLFTLSQGTKSVLANLNEPVHLRFYFSKKLAAEHAAGLVSYSQRVRELLEEYVSNSKGKVTLEVADPEPFSETEDKAVEFGLKGVPVTTGGEMLYFGLAGTGAGTSEDQTITFFQREKEDSLEYEVTKIVYNLSNPKKKIIGVLSSLPMDGDPMARLMNPRAPAPEPWVALEYLRQTFDVKVIPPTSEELDKDLEVLVLVHPQNLSPLMQFSIDQFVLGGGKVIAFVDPYCMVQPVQEDPQNPMKAMTADRSSSLGVLGDAWGIEMSKDDLAADKDLALRVPMAQGQPPALTVVFLGFKKEKEGLDKTDFTTSQLKTLNVAYAGILRKKDGATTTVTPLIETTKNSMRVEKTKIQFGPDPAKLLESFQSSGEKLMLAARINGPVKTAFPDGKPKPPGEQPDPATPPAESLKESQGPINVIVMADADMLADGLWVQVQNFFGQRLAQPFADNGAFLINAADNLSGSNDLISLRSRGRSARPFEVVADLRRDAETKFRQKEVDLQAKLRDARENIRKLSGNEDTGSSVIFTAEQLAEKERFEEQVVQTNKELRKVRHDLQSEIDDLKWSLLWKVAFLVPLVVLAIGVAVWLIRREKMKTARENALAI